MPTPSCPICYDDLEASEESELAPARTLCSHLICVKCANTLFHQALVTRRGGKGVVKHVKCPFCNELKVPVNPVTVNFGALSILQSTKQHQQQQNIQQDNTKQQKKQSQPQTTQKDVPERVESVYHQGPSVTKEQTSPLLSPVKKEDIIDTDIVYTDNIVDTDIVYTDIVDTDIVDTVNLPLLYETDAEAQDSPLLSTENNINNNNDDDNDNGNNSRKRRRKSPSTIIINTNTTKVIDKEKIKLEKDDVYCIECVLVVPLNNNQHSCILTGNRNGDIHIYNNKYKLAQQIIKAHNSSIAKFIIIDDKQHTIASTAESSLVQIWKLRTDYDGNNKNLLQKHKAFKCSWNVSEITSFQNILLCGGDNGEIELWNYNDTITSITSINNDNNHNSKIRALHMFYNIINNKPSLVSCDVRGNIKLWETNDPDDDDDDDIKNMTFIKSTKYKRVYSSCTLKINNNDNNTLIAFATAKQGIQIICGSSLDTYHTFPNYNNMKSMRGIHCMRSFMSQDGKNMIAAVNNNGYFLIFNISDKKIDSTMVVDSDLKFTTMDIDQSNNNFICGGYDGNRNVGAIVTIS